MWLVVGCLVVDVLVVGCLVVDVRTAPYAL